jgi:two-component system, NarL family, nitrate/nitrite response regulator NarL
MLDSPISILLATDFPIMRDALRSIIANTADLKLVGHIESQGEIISRAREMTPDIVIVDTSFASDSLLGVIDAIIEQNSKVLLIGGEIEHTQMIDALFRGASGIIGRKSTPDLICRSIRAVVSGELWVTRQLTSKLIELLRTDATQAGGINQAVSRMFNRDRIQKEPAAAGARRVSATPTTTPSGNRYGLTKRELQIVGALVEGQTNKDIAATFGVSEYTVKHHLTNVFDKLGVYNRLELVLFAISHQLCPAQDEPTPMPPPVVTGSFSAENVSRKR